MRKSIVGGILAVCLLSSFSLRTVAAPFSAFFVFGDSLSDGGNAFFATGGTVTMPPFPLIPSFPYPRSGGLVPALTNGPIWAEIVAPKVGAGPLLPSLLPGGTNFAFAGADTGPLPMVPTAMPPTLTDQFFLSAFPPAPAAPQFPLFGGGPILPGALYAVWGGGNDVRRAIEVYLATLTATGNTATAEAAAFAVINAGVLNVLGVISALVAGGAEHLLVLNAPNVGLAPAIDFLPPGAEALATGLSHQFNLGLSAGISAVEAGGPIDIATVDVFSLLTAAALNPAAFGLLNATGTCLEIGGSGVCSDPDSFLFWDGIHPTSAGHRIIANAVLALIPSPDTAALLALGLLALVLSLRSGSASRRTSRLGMLRSEG